MSDMPPALVLTAGLGTRLRPLTLRRAKPAVPVANVPLIIRILRGLAARGVRDVVLNLHHRPETITRCVGDGATLGLRIRYSWEWPLVLGSAGGPAKALPLLDAERFLLVNGDTLSDVPLEELVAEHRASGALATLAVVPNTDPRRYGGVLVDSNQYVTSFTRRGSIQASWHFIGIQAVEARAFASLRDDAPSETIGQLYPRLLSVDPGAVQVWRTSGVFLDVGTPADYLAANQWLARREGRSLPLVGTGCRLASSALLDDCILWDDVVVGDGARLERCVVADGARIPAGTRYVDRVIVPAPAPPVDLEGGWHLDGELIVASVDGGKPLESRS